jgi:hypothetical protein
VQVAVFSCSRLLAGVVPAACTGFVQHAEAARYSLQGLSEVNTLQQVHRCLLANCAGFFDQMHLFAAICWCCCFRIVYHANTAGYSLQGVSDRVNTRKHACIRALACCASRIGQLQLSAGCSEYCRMHRACTGFVQHGNTQVQAARHV